MNAWSSAHLDEEALFFFPNKLFLLSYLSVYPFIHLFIFLLIFSWISRLIACKLSSIFPVSSSVMDLWFCLKWLSCFPFFFPFTTLIGTSMNKWIHSWSVLFSQGSWLLAYIFYILVFFYIPYQIISGYQATVSSCPHFPWHLALYLVHNTIEP